MTLVCFSLSYMTSVATGSAYIIKHEFFPTMQALNQMN